MKSGKHDLARYILSKPSSCLIAYGIPSNEAYFMCILASAQVDQSSASEKHFQVFDWFKHGHKELDKMLELKHTTKKAKNVILFVGDGMGPATITATRMWRYQKQEQKNMLDAQLEFESFPYTGLAMVKRDDMLLRYNFSMV